MSDQSVEETVDDLVALEAELSSGPTGGVSGRYDEGTVVGATKVPTPEVPDGYPVPIHTDTALRIDVDTDGGTVATYIEWAERGGGQGHLAGLLDALDRRPDEFADVYGDRVALDYEDGFHGIDPDRTAELHAGSAGTATGSERTGGGGAALDVLDAAAGVLVWLAALVTFLATLAAVTWSIDVATWPLLLGWIGLPLSVLNDRRADGGLLGNVTTLAWTAGSVVPLANAAVAVAYLLRRPAYERDRPPRSVPQRWVYAALGAALVGSTTWLVLQVASDVFVLTWLLGIVVSPLAVYFDADDVEAVRGDGPNELLWGGLALAANVFMVGPLVVLPYLHARR